MSARAPEKQLEGENDGSNAVVEAAGSATATATATSATASPSGAASVSGGAASGFHAPDMPTLALIVALGARKFAAPGSRFARDNCSAQPDSGGDSANLSDSSTHAAPAAARALYGRIIAEQPEFWSSFDPHSAHSLTYGKPKTLAFVTDARGVQVLLELRHDSAAALRYVGWTDKDIATYATGRQIKLVVFEACPARAATWDEVFDSALPAAAAAVGRLHASGLAVDGWSAQQAQNERFVLELQRPENRARVVQVDARSLPRGDDRRVEAFLAGVDAKTPDWTFARRILQLVLYIDDFFDGSGRTCLVSGEHGCAEYLVATSVPHDSHAVVLDFEPL